MADQSILIRLRDGVASVLEGLTFTPVSGGVAPRVTVGKIETALQGSLPAWLVTTDAPADRPSSKMFAFDVVEYGYGIAVALLDRADVLADAATDAQMAWREAAELALLVPQLPGFTSAELRRTAIEGGPRVELRLKKELAPGYQGFRSAFVVRCSVLRRRV